MTRDKKLLYAIICHMKLVSRLIILPIFLLLFFQASDFVNAQQFNTAALKNSATATADLKQKAADLRASASAAKQARKDALSEFKVKACEARQAGIQKRSDQMVKRTTNQLDVFAKISQRVQEFYQSKLVPQGKTVANYDSLVADIASNGAALSPLLAKAQADAVAFSCDKDNPSGQVKAFNEDMKAVITGLQAYRKSVRNLIVAVKGATGAENGATGSAKIILTQ